jgi:integrative and conjugative element protein (TIGR02256 family)
LKEVLVELTRDARCSIGHHAELAADGKETGGILLGRGPDDGIVTVEFAGDPGPEARRRSDFFLRDLDHARALAAEQWKRSKAVWIGEWHTHLTGDPRPSPADLATYSRHLRATALGFDVFVSVIVVPAPDGCWTRGRLFPWVISAPDGLPAAGNA